MDYKGPYLKLFNQITDTIKVLDGELIKLKEARRKAEQLIIADESNEEENAYQDTSNF